MKKIILGISSAVLILGLSTTTAFASGHGNGSWYPGGHCAGLCAVYDDARCYNRDGVCDYHDAACSYRDGECDYHDGSCLRADGMCHTFTDEDGNGICDTGKAALCLTAAPGQMSRQILRRRQIGKAGQPRATGREVPARASTASISTMDMVITGSIPGAIKLWSD